MFNLSNRSAHRTNGVRPELVACTVLALRKYCKIDFGVGRDAVRSKVLQACNVADGVSWTMDSKHIPGEDHFSHAIDLYASGYPTVHDIPTEAYEEVRRAMDLAAADIGIELECGIDWRRKDSPHFQIKRFL